MKILTYSDSNYCILTIGNPEELFHNPMPGGFPGTRNKVLTLGDGIVPGNVHLLSFTVRGFILYTYTLQEGK